LFEQALAIDPAYTAAMDGLASNYNNQVSNGLLPPAEGFALSREMTQRALALDPNNANAHAQLGWLAMYYDNDPATAARHIERALGQGPPNRGIIGSAAALLVGLGRVEEALALGKYMVARDPINPTSHFNLGLYYLYAGQWEAAANAARTALRLSPDYIGAHYVIGEALLFAGEPQAALEQFALERGDDEYRVKGTALALQALGRQAQFEQTLEELIQRWGDKWPSEVAHVYAMSGDADAAFAWLDKAVAQNEDGLDHQFLAPFFVNLHDDPRWAVFLQRVGSSPEQLAAIEFKVTLPE
jgi:tetratricopeptide (TPR) repeat protein